MNEMGQNGTDMEKLTPKQQRFLTALMAERTVEAAADKAKVGRSTAYTWLKDPAFQQALKAVELSAIEEAARALVGLTTKAIDTLAAVLDDLSVAPSTRVRTADAILGRLLQLRELTSIEARISALEAQMTAKGGKR